MTKEEKYAYWLDIAKYDLDTAGVMYDSGRWIYVVFMCQQAVEKLIKGLYLLFIDDNIPRTHNIRAIFEEFEDKLQDSIPSDKYILFDKLSQYYLNNRYPEYLSKLSSQINETTAKNIITETRETFAWLLTLKP